MAQSALSSYYRASRAPRYSILFALPLLVFYELLGVILAPPGGALQVRNGAEVLLDDLFSVALGARGPLVLMAAIIGLCIWLVWRDMRGSGAKLAPSIFATMFGESLLFAALLGIVVGTITVKLLGAMHALAIPQLAAIRTLAIPALAASPIAGMSWPTKLMLALGAGLFEELLFRVLIVGALAAAGRTLLGMSRGAAGVVAVVVGAIIFSAFHYVGRYGDPFTLQSFVFRALSGVAFSALYLLRGFGITAWTHALYDVIVLLF